MGTRALLMMIAGLCLLLSLPAGAAQAGPGGFREGSARVSLFFGSAVAFDQRYTVFGAGGGYFVADGVELGLDAEQWSGNSPRITQASPRIGFVLPTDLSVTPYAGAFYRRTSIEGFHRLESVGGRAGVYFLSGGNAYFGVGVVEEVHLNCDRTIYSSCEETFPEASFAIVF